MKRKTLVMAAAVCILATAFHATAQDTTPTPAPSKTASAVPSVSSTAEATTASGTFQTLTQADLTLLTGNVQRPNAVAYFNGFLYTACTGDGTVYVIDAETGMTRTLIFGVQNAQTLYVEPDAENSESVTLWVPDYRANTLAKVSRAGVEPVVTGLNGPWGIAYVDEEHFLVTSLLDNTINLLSRSGDNAVVLDGLSAPMGIVHDGETAFVANYGSTRRSIEWYSLEALISPAPEATAETATEAEATEAPAATNSQEQVLVRGLQNVTNLQLGADGLLYFAYALGNRGLVGRVDPAACMENGGCTNEQVEIVLYSDLAVPLAGLTLTPDMRMFVHTMFVPAFYSAQLEG